MSVESYDYQAKELEATDKTEKTIDDRSKERVDAKTEGEIRRLQPFFKPNNAEQKNFKSAVDAPENATLETRVRKLEENQEQIMAGLQM